MRLRRKFKIREGGIKGRLGVTEIVGYLMEKYDRRGFSGTAMDVLFGLGGGTTTVNRMDVTALHRIANPSLLTVDMFELVFFFMFSV